MKHHKVTLTIQVQTPQLPNFLRSVDGKQCFAVEDFSEKELRAIANKWGDDLISHAKKRKSWIKPNE